MAKDKVMDEYIPIDPLQFLSEYKEEESLREVMFTMGEQEIVQDDGKFYLCHTMYPNVSKEISKETATEMWQIYNMKDRSDISFLF
jgi:hypothetical protein